tara:strand:- start:25972 stop:26586 length:615 start_codon:yes stop_codon:yes gene_type:complete
MIAFLHTSSIHIDNFENLVRKFNKNIDIKHFVNADILCYALDKGFTDDNSFENEVAKIKEFNPDLIICTCSTYGAACDKNNSIERIDYPIAEFLVTNFTKIGLVYTATSTKKVSKDLLLRIAKEQNKTIQIVDCDCSCAWTYYESIEFDKYEKSIGEKIKEFEDKVEVVFLAQASMEGAKKYLTNFSKGIYSSPEFGIQEYLKN